MAERLQENGQEVRIGNVILRTPGLSGMVEVYEPLPGGDTRAMNAAEEPSAALLEALKSTHAMEYLTIEISDAREVDLGAADSARRDASGQEVMEIEIPAAGDAFGEFILATDESGFLSWHLAKTETNAVDATRGAERRTFLIPRRVVREDEPATGETRGVMGALGKKILKVIVFPILDPLVGKVGEYFVSKWEQRKRPYGIRTFTPADYQEPVGNALGSDGWTRLADGPALLFVHGTFSRAYSAFGGLQMKTMQTLHDRYQGRVFAFDHPTLSDDPSQNVAWLMEQIPEKARLSLDVICHSRGGLVTRELARSAGARASVRKIVFAGTPNAGTILTDAKHMGDFIDSYTNLLQWFPDNAVTDVLEAVITVLKQLAVGVLHGLDGLQSMLPEGTYLRNLSPQVAGAECYAISSDYEPADGSPIAIRTADRVIDKVFGAGVRNDMVVPTAGVYEWPQGLPIPTERLHVFKGAAAPVHTRYFTEAETQRLLLRWLT